MIDSFAAATQCAEDALNDPGGLRYTHLPTLVGFVDGLRPGENPADWSPPALLVGVRLGRLLLELGLRDESGRVLRILADRLASPDDEGAVELANALGALGASLGLLDEASSALHVALAASAVSESDRVRTLVNLAAVEVARGKPHMAAAHMMRAREVVAGGDITSSGRIRQLLAAVELHLGRAGLPTAVSPSDAVTELADRAADLVEELGDGDPRSFLAVADVAVARVQTALEPGDAVVLEEALKVLEVASQRLAALLGADHPQALGVQADLAAAQVEAARVASSPARLERSVHLLESVARRLEVRLGPTHPRSVAALTNLVSAQVESVRAADEPGKAERAATALAERARRAGELFGEGHPVTRLVRASLAECRKIASGEGEARGAGTTLLLTRRDSLGDWAGGEGGYRSFHESLWELRQRMIGLGRGPLDPPGLAPWHFLRALALPSDELRLPYVPDEYIYRHLPDELPPHLSYVLNPATREFLLAPYRQASDGDTLNLVVRAVGEDGVEVGFGALDGIVPADELSIWPDPDPAQAVAVGDFIQVVPIERRDADGLLIFSKKRADTRRAREVLERIRHEDGTVTGVVVRVNDGGLILDVGLPGFMPASQIESRPVQDLRAYLGRDLRAKILVVEELGSAVLLSRRAWLEETQGGWVRSTGSPPSAHPFDYTSVPPPIYKNPQHWKSLDQLSAGTGGTPDGGWLQFARTHRPGQIVPAEVIGFAFPGVGAFVRVAEGIEGLVPVFELAEGARRAQDVVQVGDEVFVRILSVDPARRTIDLSVRQADLALGDDPAEAEFDPALYGPGTHDAAGNPFYPEGFHAEENRWLRGYARERKEWQARYAEARAFFERHRRRVISNRRREAGE